MKQRMNLPVFSTNGRIYSNTPSGQSASNISSLSSIQQLFPNSSCSNHIFPSRLSLKKIKPEPWQRLFDNKKNQELKTKKNISNVNEMMNEDFVNLLNEFSPSDENSQNCFLSAPIQAHIDHLYEQIDDLLLKLSEERIKHRQTRIKTEEIRSKQLQDQAKQFQELLENKLLDHEKELKEQENKYMKLLNEEQIKNHKHEEQLKTELDFIKKSFHTYKISLDKENIEKFQIRKQHQKEIDIIQKSLMNTTIDRERFELLNKELKLTKLELDKTKEHAINLSTRLKDLEIQHIKTTRELNDYRRRFDKKLKEVGKLYTK